MAGLQTRKGGYLVREVGVGAVFEEQPHDPDMAVLGGHAEPRGAVLHRRAAEAEAKVRGQVGRVGRRERERESDCGRR